MNLDLAELPPEDRKYVLDRAGVELARSEFASMDLMYPEVVAALLKCDVRTLEGKGLPRIELGPRNIRYRRADVERLLEENTKLPSPAAAPKKRGPKPRARI